MKEKKLDDLQPFLLSKAKKSNEKKRKRKGIECIYNFFFKLMRAFGYTLNLYYLIFYRKKKQKKRNK